MTAGFQGVSPYLDNQQVHRRKLAEAVNTLTQGKMNVTIDVTLTAGATTTTLNDARIGYYSAVIPAMAQTAHGATAITAGIYVDGLKSGEAVVHHANSANTDQNIRFVILG